VKEMHTKQLGIGTPLSMPLIDRIAYVAQKIRDSRSNFYDEMRWGMIELQLLRIKADELTKTFIYRITLFERGDEDDLSKIQL
jgi:hypothetical protein